MKFTFTEEDKMCEDCMVCEKLEFINRIHRCGASNQPIAGYSRCPHLDEMVIKITKYMKLMRELKKDQSFANLLASMTGRTVLLNALQEAGYEAQPITQWPQS